jgi:hypothetical protein
MDWDDALITLYLLICNAYKKSLWTVCQRFTNGGCQRFTDEEVMTIYILGTLTECKSIKRIHKYARRHLLSYFPNLPGYAAFVHRINRLADGFKELVSLIQSQQISAKDERVYLVDSFPVALAKHHHAYTARVAHEFASKSFNATKKMYYYGVKIHIVARKNQSSLPDIELLIVDTAGRQDGPIFSELLRPNMHNNLAFGDQAYRRPDEKRIEQEQDLKVLTPIQKQPGQRELGLEDKRFSNAVSKIRQPIESLFGWINRITGIEDASLVRSAAGLFSHIFGKLAAAMILKSDPCFDF